MCSELLRIPLTWLNQPLVDGFLTGTVVALIVVVVGIGAAVLQRQSSRGSDGSGWLVTVLLIAGLVFALPRMFPEGLPIRGYGVMVLLGSVTALWMATHRARQVGLHPDVIMSLAFGLFVCGIIGARLFYVIEYWQTRFQFDRWQDTIVAILKFTEGGLVVYGSLIGGALAFVVFNYRYRLPQLAMADLLAPCLLAGLALGRLGCLLNGCCYGGETSLPWAVTFPPGSPLYEADISSGHMLGFVMVAGDERDPRPTVEEVAPESPAFQAGLASGTRIARINNREITNLDNARASLFLAMGEEQSVRFTTAKDDVLNVEIPAAPPRTRSVHPTQIYSTIHAALLSWVLWLFYPFRRRDGEVTALMLTIYPISRFLLEEIRIDESAVFGTGLSISQNISILLFVVAGALWFYLSQQPRLLAEFRVADP